MSLDLKKPKHGEIFFVILLIVLSLAVSYLTLGRMGIWARDDAYFLLHAKTQLENFYFSSGSCTCLPIPFFEIFGYSNITLRFLQSVFLSLGCVISYFLFREIYTKKTSILASFLLVFIPFYITQGATIYPFLPPLAMGTLYCFVKYLKSKRNLFAYLSFFLLGFTVANKLNGLYLLVSLFLSVAFLREKFNLKIFNRKFLTKVLSISILCFLLGVSPILAAISMGNYRFDRPSFDFSTKLQESLRSLNRVFSSTDSRMKFTRSSVGLTGSALWRWSSNIFIVLFFLSLLGFLYRFIDEEKNKWEIFFIFITVIYFSFFILGKARPKAVHLHMILPLFSVIMVRGFQKFGRRAAIVLVIILIVLNGVKIFQFNHLLLDKKRLETEGPAFSKIHTKPLKYFEKDSRAILIDKDSKNFYKVLSGNKIQVFGIPQIEVGSGLRINEKRLKKFYEKHVDERTFLVLPSKNWKETEARKIIYYCNPSLPGNLCDSSIEAFREFTKENNISWREIGRVRSSRNITVYRVIDILESNSSS